jgi:DNA repair protein RadC
MADKQAADKQTSVHAGHRMRVRQKFMDHGLDVFSDHEVLELLLFFALPRGDVNVYAHELINQFETLHGVFAATYTALKSVSGVGENAAFLIRLVSQLERRIRISGDKHRGKQRIRSSDDAGNILVSYFADAIEEQFYIMTLTASGEVIHIRLLQTGSASGINLDFRKLISFALNDGAVAIIAAHNHLSGVALPSRADIATTAKLAELLALIDVKLADHLIVSDNDWVSMKESGLL